ncbi:hypothetical protein [Paenibacillus caui]|uniref:hypothetical protein n=1 Tax=Paenibacillus caui TaxID=2873927 RepID=UPI001CA9E1BA|nr:hypothetical protein [Paenibacillus caui]
MTTQDSNELLKHKQELIEQKQQFADFARGAAEEGEAPYGQEFSRDYVPDEQNRLKDKENRRT